MESREWAESSLVETVIWAEPLSLEADWPVVVAYSAFRYKYFSP